MKRMRASSFRGCVVALVWGGTAATEAGSRRGAPLALAAGLREPLQVGMA